MATVGVGIQWNMSERLAFRGEIAARYDHDNNTENNLAEALGYIGPNPVSCHHEERLHRRHRQRRPGLQLRCAAAAAAAAAAGSSAAGA